ncbi:hypothetical protein GCM10010833_13170 [Blastomonas aquatica]|uniref:Uncharacterized protein n=2 Tax=Blastomonas aquatica TaxID=1510276 RepID=A0ABQ1J676_9SPHN|nr:hypothetical protein [Blastomonas aquatica]GGB59712.1 hypothetical protein GCM10010833_13170 [Blastomonas aquatica]
MAFVAALLGAVALPSVPLAAQTPPQVRNAPDFAGVTGEFRSQRAANARDCCAFTAPVFDRRISFTLFDTFEPVYAAQDDRQFIQEFVPQGATVDNWTRMITLSAFRGLGATDVATTEMQNRFFNTSKGCEQPNFSRVVASGRLGDGTEYNLSTNGCGSTAAGGYPGATSGRGEQFLALLLRDAQDVHVLQYAVRGEGFAPGREPIGDDAVDAMMSRFGAIGFCRNNATNGDCSIAFSAP